MAATVLAAVVAGALHAGSGASAGPTPDLHTVDRGESLWTIVADHYPSSEDPRVLVEEVRDANDLEDYVVRPGDTLELPAAS